ncbi:MAG: Fis family transcriptional regulator [Acidithiobacillales bacterium SG8_45]|nr:MAG: Fis family transcriptional regulator [Acidithiobacillales bacterium SG8_45]
MKKKEIDEGALAKCVKRSMERYFKDLNGHKAGDLYSMVIGEVEKPLLEVVMKHAASNQCRAAELLGINRNTLRKKLKLHKLDV